MYHQAISNAQGTRTIIGFTSTVYGAANYSTATMIGLVDTVDDWVGVAEYGWAIGSNFNSRSTTTASFQDLVTDFSRWASYWDGSGYFVRRH